MRRFLFPSMIASTWLLVCGNLLAGEVRQYPECHKQPSDTDIQGAKGAFQAGNVSFKEADYERAILYWEDAFRRDCTATLLLYYLGQAYEGQGNLEQAVVALRAYLARTPDVAERPQIQRRIEVFEQKIEDERKRAAQQAADALKAQQQQQQQQPTQAAPASSPGGPELRVNPIIPAAVAGVGLAATIVCAIVYFPARSDVKDYEKKCPNRVCPSDSSATTHEAESARSRRNWGAGVGVTGLVLTLGGTGWFLLNEFYFTKRQGTAGATARELPALQPWVLTNAAGLSYSGAF
jgi:tetratricopeptide (TPR) repeat protein